MNNLKFMNTLEISINETENGQFLFLAFFIIVERTKTASIVLLLRRNPNCSGPSRPWASATSDIWPHMRTVTKRRRLLGMVIGLYCTGESESPP